MLEMYFPIFIVFLLIFILFSKDKTILGKPFKCKTKVRVTSVIQRLERDSKGTIHLCRAH
jgi:hypothetical protein